MNNLNRQQHVIIGMILITIILRSCLCITAMPLIEMVCAMFWLLSFPFSVLLWVQDRPKFSGIAILLYLYCLSYLYSSYINHAELIDAITQVIDIFMLMGVFYSAFKRNDDYPIYISIVTLSILTYVNFVMLFLYPDGIPLQGKNLFLLGGNYNQMGKVYILGMILYLIYHHRTGLLRYHLIFFAIVSILSLLIVGSMTSCIGIIVLVGFSLLPTNKLRKIGLIAFIAVYFIFHILIVFQEAEVNNRYIVGFVENILGKDMTFTYRTDIWIHSILSIAEKPMFGYGFRNTDWYLAEIGAIMPHNFVLSTLMKGGYVMMGIVALLVIASYIQYHKHPDYTHQMLFIGLWVFLFMMIMEVYTFSLLVIIFLCLAYIHLLKDDTNNPPEQNDVTQI